MIRKVAIKDAVSICEIYNYYVKNTAISFETEPLQVATMEERIKDIEAEGYPYVVYEEDDKVLGYCYLHKWNGRAAYQTTAEISIYVDKAHCRQGIGRAMMNDVIAHLDREKIHTIIAGIAIPNASSTSLHERCGFRQISHFKEVGYKLGEWRDVGHWQLILE